MVFRYVRKTNRQNWTQKNLVEAMAMVVEKKITISEAARRYNIPFTTLRRHLVKNSNEKKLGRFVPVFNEQQELALVEHIKRLDSLFYGLTRQELCELAYDFAQINGIENPFTGNSAGPQWFYNFMSRHPDLSLRTPEPTSIARCAAFNKFQVKKFFDNLKLVMDEHHFRPENMWNMDETCIRNSTTKPPKVLSICGKKQVGIISSRERGQLITGICCCSATGNYMPPCFIWPRKRMNARLMIGTPPGSKGYVTDSGWINGKVFFEWMKFFVDFTRPTEENKVLLVLDNHASHKAIDVLEYAAKNNVILLSVPPHTTNKLQPLDVSVYKPLKTALETAITRWQKAHPAMRISFYDVGAIFSEALLKCTTPLNAINGFKKTGILNCDMDVFSEEDFMPSLVTEIEQNQMEISEKNENEAEPGTSARNEMQYEEENESEIENELEDEDDLEHDFENAGSSQNIFPPITSITDSNKPGSNNSSNKISGSRNETQELIMPEIIHPIPKSKRGQTKTRRKAGKSEILTSPDFISSEKEKTQARIKVKKQKENAKQKKSVHKKLEKKKEEKSKEASLPRKRGRPRKNAA